MNGPEIFTFTLKAVPAAVAQLAERWGRPMGQVDLFVFHQANTFMLKRLRAKLKIPEEKFWLEMETCANTVSSTIPIALESAFEKGVLRRGDWVMLVGFGVGYSWAATMLRF
jgi:3-oxoacyl-[acyl-carrier-protein] synthase-3